MTDKPILFGAPMIRALLAGTKTQTRRVVKPQPPEDVCRIEVSMYHPIRYDRHGDAEPGAEIFGAFDATGSWGCKCPYGKPGDRLWVREAYRFLEVHDHVPPREISGGDVRYEAWPQGFVTAGPPKCFGKLRPGIHMPRWASRITLEITDVRVERLGDISEADAIAEGCHGPDEDDASNAPDCPQCGGTGLYTAFNSSTGGALPDTDCRLCDTPVKRYRLLWQSINGSYDPATWVWVVVFKLVTP